MKYTVEMTSDGMIYARSFNEDWFGHSGNIPLLPRQSERLQCWFY
jgi:hypothetical protein